MNAVMSEWLAQEVAPVTDPRTLLYFAGAGLITLGIETLRRWVKHRMDLWESRNPVQKKDEDDDA